MATRFGWPLFASLTSFFYHAASFENVVLNKSSRLTLVLYTKNTAFPFRLLTLLFFCFIIYINDNINVKGLDTAVKNGAIVGSIRESAAM